MTTAQKNETLQSTLNQANPNQLADAIRKLQLGNVLAPVKVTFTGLASAAAQDITTAAAKAAATIVGLDLAVGQNLPAILSTGTIRVTAGAAAAGARFATDAGGTASTTVALLSDDGTTLTFEAAVTGFVLEYTPRSALPLDGQFEDFI